MPNPRPPRPARPLVRYRGPYPEETKAENLGLLRRSRKTILSTNLVGLCLGLVVGAFFATLYDLLSGVLIVVFTTVFSNIACISPWSDWRLAKMNLAILKENAEYSSDLTPAEIIPFHPPLRVVSDDESGEEDER